jgi:hypothetical protein
MMSISTKINDQTELLDQSMETNYKHGLDMWPHTIRETAGPRS